MTHTGHPAAEKMESEEKADISTLEKTGHLYFGPTKIDAMRNAPAAGDSIEDGDLHFG